MYEKFAPLIHRDGLSLAELDAVQALESLADSGLLQYLIISGGLVENRTAAWTVPAGGTGLISLTPFALLTGGVSATGAMQQIVGVGSAGQVLTSNGDNALPTWQDAAAISGSGVTIETPTGAVDSSNTTYTVTAEPKWVVADGTTYFDGVGYTYAALSITMTVPPSQYIRAFI